MSEAKYGKTMTSSIVPVFRFAHTGYWLKTYTFNRSLSASALSLMTSSSQPGQGFDGQSLYNNGKDNDAVGHA